MGNYDVHDPDPPAAHRTFLALRTRTIRVEQGSQVPAHLLKLLDGQPEVSITDDGIPPLLRFS
ncbi:MAG: hypothetical protein ACLQRM_18240, partial [Acidimicrobiales bacterium]